MRTENVSLYRETKDERLKGEVKRLAEIEDALVEEGDLKFKDRITPGKEPRKVLPASPAPPVSGPTTLPPAGVRPTGGPKVD